MGSIFVFSYIVTWVPAIVVLFFFQSRIVKNILVPVPTTRGRLAEKLGIGAQKNQGILPANISRQRNHAGIPTLHLFGRPDDLEYFSSGLVMCPAAHSLLDLLFYLLLIDLSF